MSDLLDRVRALMDRSGIKAKQLTDELGISNSSFSDWKKGKGSPSLDTVVKFSDYFHVSIDYLVHGTEFTDGQKDTTSKHLDFSNLLDKELLDKFHVLSPELQWKLLGYIDCLLTTMPVSSEGEKGCQDNGFHKMRIT